jgi:hypothetical protein
MRILWIEDFPDEMGDQKSTSEKMFKDLINNGNTFSDFTLKDEIHIALPEYFKKKSIHEIEICYSRESYEKDFKEKLFNFDIFIIDINLSSKTGHSQESNDSSKWDGFGIYNDMIRLGINEQNISLMTANSDELKEVCKRYTIPIPSNLFIKDIKKDKDGNYKKIDDESGYASFRTWLQRKANTPYIQLRRGILEACDFFFEEKHKILLNLTLKKDGEGEKIDELSKEYGKEFIIHIKNLFLKDFLLEGKEKTQKLYTFLMVLSAEWERGESKDKEQSKHFKEIENQSEKSFYESIFWIMCNLRNCFAHFTFTKENLLENDVAFFFILAMRGFFEMDINKIEEYEKIIFPILKNFKVEINKNDLIEIDKESLNKIKKLYAHYKLNTAQRRGKQIEEPTDFQAYVFRFLFGCTQNDNKDLKPIPKEDIQKESKEIFYKSYLIKMETILVDTNSKDKLFYKLGAFALEAVSKT